MIANRELKDIIIRELSALGQYYRKDWSELNGKTLEAELGDIIRFIENPQEDFTDFSDMLREQDN